MVTAELFSAHVTVRSFLHAILQSLLGAGPWGHRGNYRAIQWAPWRARHPELFQLPEYSGPSTPRTQGAGTTPRVRSGAAGGGRATGAPGVWKSDYKRGPDSPSVCARPSRPGPGCWPQAPDLGKGVPPPAQGGASRRLVCKDRGSSCWVRAPQGPAPAATRRRPAQGGGERAPPPTPPHPDLHPSRAHTHLLGGEHSPPAVHSGSEPRRGALRCRHRDPRPPKHPAPHPQLRPPGRSGAEARAGRRPGVGPQTGRGRGWRGGDWAEPCPRAPDSSADLPNSGVPATTRAGLILPAGEAHLLMERGS